MTSEQILNELERQKTLESDVIVKLRRETLLSGRSAEDIISERRLVGDVKLAELKSQLLKVPYQKIDFAAFDDKLLELIPEETVRTYGVVPISKRGDVLVAGMLQPDDMKAQEALKFVAQRARLSLGVYLVSWGDWQEVLRKYSPYKSSVEAAVRGMRLRMGEGGGQKVVRLEEEAAKAGEEAPIIRIVADTLREAAQTRASDIHIEPQQAYLRVRFRVDGDLREVAELPLELSQPVVSRIKVLCNLKIDETRVPQDGRFRAKVFDHEIDFRVSTFPTPLGEKMAIRVLDPTTGLKSFDELGVTGRNLEAIKEGLDKPFGMILITGPTGSGKTTTLYALLQTLNKEEVNIVSLEDPVEYFVGGVNQSQVRPEIGYDFASGLRQILRQDPDVIMVGEVRDSETAELAIQAALTGHIVLSTLHTNNAAGVIPRLLDMKVEAFLLPVSLNLMISQRLVGLLCPDCKTAETAPPAVQKIIKKDLGELPSDVSAKYEEPYKTYRSPGCPKCRNRGTVGRVALYEVLKMTPALEEVINTGPTLQKVLREAKEQGMVNLRQDGVLKALAGLIAIEEVIRSTEEM